MKILYHQHALQMGKFSCKNHLRIFWQLYCMAVNFFDNCTVWSWPFETFEIQFDNCTVWLWTFLTIVLYDHNLDVLNFINRTLLLDMFSYKNHSKMQFDNFTGWLWPIISFWQFFPFGCELFLTVVLYGCQPKFVFDNYTAFCFKIFWQFSYLTKVP